VCVIELYQQAVYKENTNDTGFDVVNADTAELVTLSTNTVDFSN